jgi:phage baseplate assembly protein W
MRLGESEIVAVSTTVAEQAHDNLRNLIQTNWGDRLGRYDYGADIRPIMFELNNSQDAFDSQAIARIKAAVGRWMPYVVLETFTSTIGRFNTISKTTIRLDITYSIPALDVTSRGLQVVLYSA